MTCTSTGPPYSLAWRRACSVVSSSWPSIGPMYLMPRSSNSTWGWRKSFRPFFAPCSAPNSGLPTIGAARDRGLDEVKDVLVALADPDGAQVGGEAADRRLVGAAVVVDDDDEPAVPGDRDVVQRLPGHAAGQRAVADHGDDRAVVLAAQLVRLGHAVGVGQGRGGVAVLHEVVLGLGPARVARQAAGLPQRVELAVPPGQQLVHVGLVPGVEDHLVLGRVEHPVQRDGQLDHAEVRAQVAAGPRYRFHQDIADLGRQEAQLLLGEVLEVLRAVDALKQGHGCSSCGFPRWITRY